MNSAKQLYMKALEIYDQDKDIADAIGISHQRLSHSKSGRNGMPVRVIYGLCEITGEDPAVETV